MKTILFLTGVAFCLLICCHAKSSETVQVLITKNKLNLIFKDFSIYDSTLNKNIYFHIVQDSSLLVVVNKSKLIKIDFHNDSTFNVKSYIYSHKKYVNRGDLGEFESKRIISKYYFENFLIKCFFKSFG